jgi:uncharacterized protein YggE
MSRRTVITIGVASILALTVVAFHESGTRANDGASSRRPTQLIAAPAAANSTARTVTGSGTGHVHGRPDTLTLDIGVESHARSATEALSRNNDAVNKVIGVLKDAGVNDKDIQTSQLSIEPNFDDKSHQLNEYSVSNSVTAKLHDLDNAGKVIDAAANAAGDEIRVNGVSFSIDDTSKLVEAARADAVKRAMAQAGQLASAAGVALGDIQSIQESGAPVRAYAAEGDQTTKASSVPIQPGTQDLTVDVAVIFAIK